MDKLQITAAGRARVASDDFAKCLVHVVGASSLAPTEEEGHCMVATYTALALASDQEKFVAVPDNQALADFVNANMQAITDTIRRVMQSPTFITHAIEAWGQPPEAFIDLLGGGQA